MHVPGAGRFIPALASLAQAAWASAAAFSVLGFGVHDLGFLVRGSGFRVQGLGFGIQGSGFRVQGSGFGVYGLRFGVLLGASFACRVRLGTESTGFAIYGLLRPRIG